MNDLAFWLLEQVAEDERRIQRVTLAATGGWRYDRERFRLNELDGEGQVRWNLAARTADPETPIGDVLGEYMEHFQPARMQAECEAKRKLIRWVLDWPMRPSPPSSIDGVLERLALPYAGRPGYRPEWKP